LAFFFARAGYEPAMLFKFVNSAVAGWRDYDPKHEQREAPVLPSDDPISKVVDSTSVKKVKKAKDKNRQQPTEIRRREQRAEMRVAGAQAPHEERKDDPSDAKEDSPAVVVPQPSAAVPVVIPPSPGLNMESPETRLQANIGRADSPVVVAATVPAQAIAPSDRSKPPEVQVTVKIAGPSAAVSGSKPAGNVGAAKVKAAPPAAPNKAQDIASHPRAAASSSAKMDVNPSGNPKPKGVQLDPKQRAAVQRESEALLCRKFDLAKEAVKPP